MLRACSLAACLSLVVAAVGCGGQEFELVPVAGTVTFNGKPLVNATITFDPVPKSPSDLVPGPSSTAKTGADGKFVLKAILPAGDKPGAVAGRHRVTIQSERKDVVAPGREDNRREPANDPIPMRFRDGTHEMSVPEEGTDKLDIDIPLS